jgi:DNA-binding response OmpR family regulator
LKRLLQQILDFRKTESGNMKLKVGKGDIVPFIKDICYQNFSPLIKSKNIRFSFTASCDSIEAYFDADKIDKVIFNLLSNAFKYTKKEGEIHVLVDIIERSGKEMVQVAVSDTGKGIAPEALPEIFNRFFHNKLADFGKSNGIGLSLTKELLELHHGTLSVESQLGVGTTFVFEIPLHAADYTDEERTDVKITLAEEVDIYVDETENTDEENQTDTNGLADIHILIVEDNADLRRILRNFFSKKYPVHTAKNGREALEIVKEQEINIVVSDVMMPEMDGLELCRTLKNDNETNYLEILLLTAKNSIEDRIACYNAGADGYISKPFEISILEAKINSLIKNRKQRIESFKSTPDIQISNLNLHSINETFLKDAIQIIEEHLSDADYNIDMFAQGLNMSKASLYRKIKSLTGLSPIEFVKNIRLKHACIMLKNQSGNIAEIAYDVGFTDPKYFTSCFKTEFGMPPSEYIKRNKPVLN